MSARTSRLDVGLRLLDHQLVGRKGELLGNVDNAVLEDVAGALTLTAVVAGTPGLAPRFGGRLERWMQSIWVRLRPQEHPTPTWIPLAHVTSIGSAVQLDESGAALAADGLQLERWLRRYVVSRIPGATGGDDRVGGTPELAAHTHAPKGAVDGREQHLVSDLIGAGVRTMDGDELGAVLDLTTDEPPPGRDAVGPLTVSALLYGRHRIGAKMGYPTQSDQGPWLIAAPMRAWHRENRLVPIGDVDHIDWQQRMVVLSTTDHAVHPHQG